MGLGTRCLAAAFYQEAGSGADGSAEILRSTGINPLNGPLPGAGGAVKLIGGLEGNRQHAWRVET
jgi:hypothetical protein